MSRRSAQPPLSTWHRVLREALWRWHDWDLIEIRWSPGVRRRSRIVPREGPNLVLGQVVEPGLLGQARKDLYCVTFRLSKMRSLAQEPRRKRETPPKCYGRVWGRSSRSTIHERSHETRVIGLSLYTTTWAIAQQQDPDSQIALAGHIANDKTKHDELLRDSSSP